MNNMLLAAVANPNDGSSDSYGIKIGDYTIGGVISNLDSVDDLITKVSDILNWVIGFSVVVAIGLIIFAAYRFITAAGDPDKIDGASKALTAALIGMAIVFLSKTLIIFFLKLVLGN